MRAPLTHAVARRAEPDLLSAAMEACCDAGWYDHAIAINMTLCAAGHRPSTAALNALMAMQLRRADPDSAIDTFVEMRKEGPPPDRTSHALATTAAAARKATWSGLRNLMRRNWLKIPWNPQAANAALCAFVRDGNLLAAASVVSHMQTTGMGLRRESLEALLGHASHKCESAPTTVRVLEALQEHAAAAAGPTAGEGLDSMRANEGRGKPAKSVDADRVALPASTHLLALPHLAAGQRLAYIERALGADDVSPRDDVLLRATLVLLLAADGRGEDAATELLHLHAAGVDLQVVDDEGWLGRALRQMTPRAVREVRWPARLARLNPIDPIEPVMSLASYAIPTRPDEPGFLCNPNRDLMSLASYAIPIET